MNNRLAIVRKSQGFAKLPLGQLCKMAMRIFPQIAEEPKFLAARKGLTGPLHGKDGRQSAEQYPEIKPGAPVEHIIGVKGNPPHIIGAASA